MKIHRPTLQEAQDRLDPERWSTRADAYQLDATRLHRVEERLVGEVIFAGDREGFFERVIDEGELGIVSWVEPGELYDADLATGCVALTVTRRDGSTRVWMYQHGAHVELPYRRAVQEVA